MTGAEALGAVVVDYGVVTTPQLHWVIKAFNNSQPHSVADYYATLTRAFSSLVQTNENKQLEPTAIDCANGVGWQALQHVQAEFKSFFNLQGRNTGDGSLNEECGADYVQKAKCLPRNFSQQNDVNTKIASFDGDADRVVYYYHDGGKFHLLDGAVSLLLSFFFFSLVSPFLFYLSANGFSWFFIVFSPQVTRSFLCT